MNDGGPRVTVARARAPRRLATLTIAAFATACAREAPAPKLVDVRPPPPTASVAPRAPVSLEEAMTELRAARSESEATRGRPSASKFESAARDLRALGVEAHVVALRATGTPEMLEPERGLVPVADATFSDWAELEFELDTGGATPAIRARRLLARGTDQQKIVRVADRGFLVAEPPSALLLFPSLDAEPQRLAGDASPQVSERGWVALLGDTGSSVVDGRTGAEVFPIVPGLDRFGTYWIHGGAWLSSCEFSSGERAVAVVDVASKRILFSSEAADGRIVEGCGLDETTNELVIVYGAQDGKKSSFESWSLETGKRLAAAPLKQPYIPDLRVELDGSSHTVGLVSAPYQGSRTEVARFDVRTGIELRPRNPSTPSARPRPPSDPLAGVPIGQASSSTDLRALERFATAGHELVDDFFSMNAGWSENAVLSQDRATLALLEDDASGSGDPAVLLVDAKSLTLSKRVPLSLPGYHWSTLEFLDPKTLLARLEWSYWIVDVTTGEVMVSADYDGSSGTGDYEGPKLLAPDVLTIGSLVFDLRRNGLPLADRTTRTPYFSLQNGSADTDDAGITLTSGDASVSIAKTGAVTFKTPEIPDWLVCVVGDEVFPFEACRAWK